MGEAQLSKLSFWPITLAALVALSCGSNIENKGNQAPAAIPVSTAKAALEKAVYYNEYPATVTPLKQVDLIAMANGYITAILFKDGQRVSKGQKLYEIDQTQYKAGIAQAQANVNAAIASEVRAQKDLDRYTELAKRDAIAKQVLDNSIATLESAKMQVQAAKAAAETSGVNLRYANIFAPFSGTIGISQVRVGTLVSSGQTLLNSVSTDNPMAVDLQLNQQDISLISSMLGKEQNVKDSIFTLILPGGKTYTQPGRVSLMDRAVDPQTGTIRVRLQFPNNEALLRPGMTATLKIKQGGAEPALLIPNKAIVEQMGEFHVYAVAGDSVREVPVVLGQKIGDQIVVSSGLEENTEVVVEGIQKLHQGAKIQKANSN